MKKFNQPILVLFFIGLFLNSCSSIKVYSDFDSDIDFDKYQSFAFYKEGIDKVEISDIDKKRILKSIEKNFTQKGISINKNPDLLINISTKSSENIYIDTRVRGILNFRVVGFSFLWRGLLIISVLGWVEPPL